MDGQITQYTLKPVKHCKQATVNLFSLTSALSKGEVLSSDDQNNIDIKQDGMKIVFDWQIKTCDGWVCGMDVLPYEAQSVEYANTNVDSIMMRKAGIKQRNESCKKVEKAAELYQEKSSVIKKGSSKRYQLVSQSIGSSIRDYH